MMSKLFRDIDLSVLKSFLGLRAGDAAVALELRIHPDDIKTLEYVGYVEFKEEGVDATFRKASMLGLTVVAGMDPLCLDTFHFHSEGHEGYKQYSGKFPCTVEFGDSMTEVQRKMEGTPERGGGGYSTALGKPYPQWLRYDFDGCWLHFQFDERGGVEMISLQLPPKVHPRWE